MPFIQRACALGAFLHTYRSASIQRQCLAAFSYVLDLLLTEAEKLKPTKPAHASPHDSRGFTAPDWIQFQLLSHMEFGSHQRRQSVFADLHGYRRHVFAACPLIVIGVLNRYLGRLLRSAKPVLRELSWFSRKSAATGVKFSAIHSTSAKSVILFRVTRTKERVEHLGAPIKDFLQGDCSLIADK